MARFNPNNVALSVVGFHPTDHELISYFLFRKLSGTLSPLESSLIPLCDVYSGEHLSQIFQRFSSNPICPQDEFYCFTQLKKKKSRIQRSVQGNGGSWHGEDSGFRIPVELIVNEKPVNTESVKKRFSFRGKGAKENSGWIMNEFFLFQ